MRILIATMVLLCVAYLAHAQTGTTKHEQVPDLHDVVKEPERKSYYMFCEETVDVALEMGLTRVHPKNLVGGDRPILFKGYPRLVMRVLELPGFSSDPIPTLLHVEMCIEDATGWVIEPHTFIPRDNGLRMMPQRLRSE